MQDLGWRRRWGSCPAARRGARQRAGLTPASASNTLSCLLEMLHSKQLRSIKMLVDSNHGIYCSAKVTVLMIRRCSANKPQRVRPRFSQLICNRDIFVALLALSDQIPRGQMHRRRRLEALVWYDTLNT